MEGGRWGGGGEGGGRKRGRVEEERGTEGGKGDEEGVREEERGRVGGRKEGRREGEGEGREVEMGYGGVGKEGEERTLRQLLDTDRLSVFQVTLALLAMYSLLHQTCLT